MNRSKLLSLFISIFIVLGSLLPFSQSVQADNVSEVTYYTPTTGSDMRTGDCLSTSGTFLYEFDKDRTGVYGMCVYAGGKSPSGKRGVITELNKNDYTDLITIKDGSNVNHTFSKWNILQAAAKATELGPNCNRYVFLFLHKYASEIMNFNNVSYDLKFAGNVEKAARNVFVSFTEGVKSTDAERHVYIWTPEGDPQYQYQRLILSSPGSAKYYASARYNVNKTSESSSSDAICGAVFAVADHTLGYKVERIANSGRILSNIVIRALKSSEFSKSEIGKKASNIVLNSYSQNTVQTNLSSLFISKLGFRSNSYKPTKDEITQLYYIFTGTEGWTDYSNAGIAPGTTTLNTVVGIFVGAVGLTDENLNRDGINVIVSNNDGHFNSHYIAFSKSDYTSPNEYATGCMAFAEICGGFNKKSNFKCDNDTYFLNISMSPNGGSYNITNKSGNIVYPGGQIDNNGVAVLSNSAHGLFENRSDDENVYMNSNISLSKKNEKGTSARGAEFTLYSDSSTKNAIGSLTDKDNSGRYSIYINSSFFRIKSDTDSTHYKRTIYLKETAPATEVYSNGKWIPKKFSLSDDIYSITYDWVPSTGHVDYTVYKGKQRIKSGSVNRGAYNTTNTTTINIDLGDFINYEIEEKTINTLANIIKVDQNGNAARGAVFTVYQDKSLTKDIGNMTDASKTGEYTYKFDSGLFGEHFADETKNLTYKFYIKETSPANEVMIDGKWIKKIFKPNNDVYELVLNWTPSSKTATYSINDITNNKTLVKDKKSDDSYVIITMPDKVNYSEVTAQADVVIRKTDEAGNSARGAEFVLYSDSNCSKAVKQLNDSANNGIYTADISDNFKGKFADDIKTVTATYYLKETKPATQYKAADKWVNKTMKLTDKIYKITVSWTPSTGIISYEAIDLKTNQSVTKGSADSTVKLDLGKQINYSLTSCSATIETKKQDQFGYAARGAEFTVYTDEKLTAEAGKMTSDNKGNYEYNVTADFFGRRYKDETTELTKELYVKETAPATEVLINGEWIKAETELDAKVHKIKISWNPSTGIMKASADGKSYDPTKDHIRITLDPIVNHRYKPVSLDTKIVFDKVDQDGNAAKGAEFVLYNDAELSAVAGIFEDNEGTYSLTLDDSVWGSKTTKDEDSDHVFYMKETKPATMVRLNDQWEEREFVLSEDIYEIDIKYCPSKGYSEYKVIDLTTSEPVTSGKSTSSDNEIEIKLHNEISFDDHKIPNTVVGSVSLNKVNEKLESLSGAVFEVTDKDNVVVGTIECKDGSYKTSGLKVGEYSLREIEAPENYEIDPNTYDFVISTQKPDVVVDNLVWDVIDGKEGMFIDVNPIYATTALSDETNEHIVSSTNETSLTDTVEMRGLIPGESYLLRGTIRSENGEAILAQSEVTFTSDATSITIAVPFTIDSTALAGQTVVIYEDLIRADKTVGIHHELIDDQKISFPKIGTLLISDTTSDHITSVNGPVTLTDTVSYTNLIPNKEYALEGILMDLTTGKEFKDANGESVTGKTTFIPSNRNGTCEVQFVFDPGAIEGRAVVAFEKLSINDHIIAEHNDLKDLDQTMNLPSIKTTFTDDTTHNHIASAGNTRLTDKVEYKGLMTDREYEIVGTVMVKDTNEPLKDAAGNIITFTELFTPNEPDGFIECCFDIDTTGLEGKTLVAFETLNMKNVSLALHADINDKDQSVYVSNIRTTAQQKDIGSNYVASAENITITDTVSYTNLSVGKEYRLSGRLIDKETGESLTDAEGNVITGMTSFVCESVDGQIEVDFNIDGIYHAGKTIVVFEELYYNDAIIVIHEDINDEAQTVYVPSIYTYASVNNQKVFSAEDNIKLIDKVEYQNLKVGQLYKLRGQQMTTDGNEFLIDGKPVISEIEFVPEKSSGTIDVAFDFDASSVLENKDIVIFETLTSEGNTIVDHKDPNNKSQTVSIKAKPSETPTVTPIETPPVKMTDIPKTGEYENRMSIIGTIGFLSAGLILGYVSKKKKER